MIMRRLVTFVCWGNICRSAMAEQVMRAYADRHGCEIDVDSAGVSSEEAGHDIDPRAKRTLLAHGYPVGSHRAKKASRELIEDSDLVVAFEDIHCERLRRIAPNSEVIHLITDFDPSVPNGTGVDDPWYGDDAAFEDTLASIEGALSGIMTYLESIATR